MGILSGRTRKGFRAQHGPECAGGDYTSATPDAEPKKRKKPLKGGLDWKF